MTKTQLYSVSISARATLDMHSLNNEGGEGNQIQTRMVNIVDQNGNLHNVNAISGDMYKHIQAEHLFHIARANNNMPLSTGAAEFNANRINADSGFVSRTKDMSDAETLDDMLRSCAVSDMEGILVTENKRSLPRKSVVEFGWVIGVPEHVETDSYFHVKYVNQDRSKSSESREVEGKSGANLGQSIFHRPASSGIYATICHLELARIGFNDITQEYAITSEQRAVRAQALLESVLYTFLKPNGAMRAAQAPHIVTVEGVVSTSTGATPAPTVSPLKDDYREQIGRIHQALGQIAADTVQIFSFDSLADLTDIMGDLMNNTEPYTIRYQEA
ncbi:MAG: DevR family CRISPR-associated autoregulator [Anaerolineae bacterium]|nr:DevR family CRISPR-associated autoregulator [Anaerolineae bacterium]MDQ7034318.1 DevR family CRISPR-associated autoregulator [Anaerolineae bacterium]